MIFKISKANQNASNPSEVIKLRCPGCRQKGSFEPYKDVNDYRVQIKEGGSTFYLFGQRVCPDPECRTHIFFVLNTNGHKLLATYPAERIDFDSTDIPQSVIESFEEAITCHASQNFIAAAIMVRKTLEELCRDRGATGPNLKKRIEQLGTKVVLPQELLAGLDDLRLLGNDAAHIESQVFNQVGRDEVEISIEFTKEVLKATYQYTSLLNKLRGLKKSP